MIQFSEEYIKKIKELLKKNPSLESYILKNKGITEDIIDRMYDVMQSDRESLEKRVSSLFIKIATDDDLKRDYIWYLEVLYHLNIIIEPTLSAPAAVGLTNNRRLSDSYFLRRNSITESISIIINPYLFFTLNYKQQVAILIHEAMHIVRGHLNKPLNAAHQKRIEEKLKQHGLEDTIDAGKLTGKILNIAEDILINGYKEKPFIRYLPGSKGSEHALINGIFIDNLVDVIKNSFVTKETDSIPELKKISSLDPDTATSDQIADIIIDIFTKYADREKLKELQQQLNNLTQNQQHSRQQQGRQNQQSCQQQQGQQSGSGYSGQQQSGRSQSEQGQGQSQSGKQSGSGSKLQDMSIEELNSLKNELEETLKNIEENRKGQSQSGHSQIQGEQNKSGQSQSEQSQSQGEQDQEKSGQDQKEQDSKEQSQTKQEMIKEINRLLDRIAKEIAKQLDVTGMDVHDHNLGLDEERINRENLYKETLSKAGELMTKVADSMIRTGGGGRGTMPSAVRNLLELYEDLKQKEVVISEALKKIIGSAYISNREMSTRTRPNLIFPRDPNYPGTKDLYNGNLSVVVDTSGSMSNRELEFSMKYIKKIANSLKINVAVTYIDTLPHPFESISRKTKQFEFKGGGGTFMSPGIMYSLINIPSVREKFRELISNETEYRQYFKSAKKLKILDEYPKIIAVITDGYIEEDWDPDIVIPDDTLIVVLSTSPLKNISLNVKEQKNTIALYTNIEKDIVEDIDFSSNLSSKISTVVNSMKSRIKSSENRQQMIGV